MKKKTALLLTAPFLALGATEAANAGQSVTGFGPDTGPVEPAPNPNPTPVTPVAPVQEPTPIVYQPVANPTVQPSVSKDVRSLSNTSEARSSNDAIAAPTVNQVNVQQNRTLNLGNFNAPVQYQVHGDIRCPGAAFYANGGYQHSGGYDGYGGSHDLAVQAGITVPLGNGGCKKAMKARELRQQNAHCIKMLQAAVQLAKMGYDPMAAMGEGCEDHKLVKVQQAAPPLPPTVVHAPPVYRPVPPTVEKPSEDRDCSVQECKAHKILY